MNRECKNCIKYKTMYCPNSDKCLSKENKPFYEDKYTILTKSEALEEGIKDYIEELQTLKIQISAREEENKQLKDNWNKLKECLKDVMNSSAADDKEFVKTILDIMQEIEQGSDK